MKPRRVKTTADEARNRKRVNVSLDVDLHEFSSRFAKKEGISYSELIDRWALAEQTKCEKRAKSDEERVRA